MMRVSSILHRFDTSHLASEVRLGDEEHAPDAANAQKLQQAYTALRLITDVGEF